MKTAISCSYWLVILLASMVLAGCGEAEFAAKQRLHSGTLVAVEACVTRNESELVSNEVIRDKCVAKHEFQIPSGIGGSSTGYWSVQNADFWVVAANDSESQIVTRLKVNIYFYGDAPTTTVKEFSNLWILPGHSTELQVLRDEIEKEGNLTELKHPDDWSWGVAGMYGIEISVD